jgi:pyruvate dehydrogenase E2 component (dihydrolipoamide acetyltransferase)
LTVPEVPIRMPKMSMTMEEGEFNNWLVSVGDTITKGQAVAVVMTDKVEMEVESEVEGTVTRLTAGEGDTIKVGGELGYVEAEDDDGLGDVGDLL